MSSIGVNLTESLMRVLTKSTAQGIVWNPGWGGRFMSDEAEGSESSTLSPAVALRAAMEERNWSQSDLAYVLGVKSAVINQILAGKRGISSEMAKALAVAFVKPTSTFARVQAEWEL